jgi:uncharacterized protein with NRDE domain
MCTLIVLNRVQGEFPVVIAANRDEYHHKSATPPSLLWRKPRIVGGLDKRSGGTWLGVSESGFFVAVTNQRTGNPSERTIRSRGRLVLDCLKDDDPQAVRERLERLSPDDYNPCNLLFGNARELWVAYLRRDASLDLQRVEDGIHVLPNDRIDSPRFRKVARAQAILSGVSGSSWPVLSGALRRALSDHIRPPLRMVPKRSPGTLMPRILAQHLDSLCVHAFVYGTRSSALLALGEGRVHHYLATSGAPCRSEFYDLKSMLVGGR